jgi:hypothetical protein
MTVIATRPLWLFRLENSTLIVSRFTGITPLSLPGGRPLSSSLTADTDIRAR